MDRDEELHRLPSMHEIEPSPVEDSPTETRESYFPWDKDNEAQKPIQRSSNFGLSSHSTVWYLTRIQKYSSYTFSVFTAFHVANTSVIPLIKGSVADSERYLLLTRPYYQSWPIAEPLLILLPLAAHITSGIALRLHRRRQDTLMYGAEDRKDRRKIPWPKVSGISKLGYLFVPLLAGHTYINRVVPLKVHGGSSSINLSYVSHAFAKHPAVSFAGFSALISVGVWHFTWGWAKYLNFTPVQVTQGGQEGRMIRKRRWYLINAASALVTALWMAGGLGIVGRGGEVSGWVGREYDELYQSIPVIGKWL